MYFGAGQRRVEYAHQAQVAPGGAQDVLVMLVQHIERAGPDRIDGAGRHVDDFALAVGAVIGLVVMLVVQVQLGAFLHAGVIERIADAVALDQHAQAFPAGAARMAFGIVQVRCVDNYHGWTAGGTGGIGRSAASPASASSTRSARASSAPSRARLPVNIRPTGRRGAPPQGRVMLGRSRRLANSVSWNARRLAAA